MSVQKRIEAYTFNSSSLNKYDELLNVEMRRRYSDTGFAQQGQWQLSPRKPFYNTPAIPPSYTWSASDMFVNRDRANVLRAYRIINKTTNWTRVYWLQYTELTQYSNWTINVPDWFTTWTDIRDIYTSASATDVKFTLKNVKVPVMSGSSAPYVCATPSVSSAVDRIKRNMVQDTDVNTGNRSGANAIGRIIMVYRSQFYIWVYWYVIDYDSSTDEYITEGTWMIGEPLPTWATYAVYDTMYDVLRITSSVTPDYYYDWITYDWQLSQIATDSLRKVKALQSSQYPVDSILFWNAYWTFSWTTIYESKGFPWNPFYYTYNSWFTIADRDITGLYVYRNKLIVYWRSFIYAYSQSWVVEKLSNSIWVQDNAIYETWDDLYFISPDKKIISVNELASGNLYIKDISEKFNSYTSTWNNNCFIGSDTKNIYFGWCKSESWAFQSKMYMLVFSLDKKFWSVYECPPFKWIYTFNGISFFTHRWINSHAYMESWDNYYSPYEIYTTTITNAVVPTLTSLPYTQRVVTEWVEDWWYKEVEELELTLENVPTYNIPSMVIVKRLSESIATSDKKTIQQSQISSAWWIWTWLTGYEISGWTQYAIDTLFPRKKYQTFNKDSCLAFKIVIENWDDEYGYNQWFFLSELYTKYNINSANDWRNTSSTY